jgi:two-component sensor histidine kinase
MLQRIKPPGEEYIGDGTVVLVQSLRNAGSAAQGREALEGRLVSLARAHDVLTREHWELANVTDVVASALSPYFAKIPNHQLHISGPKLLLKPKAALAFALVLHELATNAVKYGALLNESGKISVDWQVTSTEPQQVVFRWKERGGPTSNHRKGAALDRGLSRKE